MGGFFLPKFKLSEVKKYIASWSYTELMSKPLFIRQFRDIFLLPFNVTITIPFILSYWNFPYPGGTGSLLFPGWILLIFGLFIFVITVSLFHSSGQGTLAPWDATKKLVIKGPYRYVRNPMISGVLCILLSESLLLDSVPMLIWAVIFFTINTLYFIFKEEPDLEKRFGSEYTEYKQAVPRWLPRMKAYNKLSDSMNNHEHQQ